MRHFVPTFQKVTRWALFQLLQTPCYCTNILWILSHAITRSCFLHLQCLLILATSACGRRSLKSESIFHFLYEVCLDSPHLNEFSPSLAPLQLMNGFLLGIAITRAWDYCFCGWTVTFWTEGLGLSDLCITLPATHTSPSSLPDTHMWSVNACSNKPVELN